MKKIYLKMKALECSQDFSHYKSMGNFRFGQGQLTPQPFVRSALNSKSVQTLRLSSLPDSIKNVGARVFKIFYINFSDTKGQITVELVVVSGRNLNLSKLSCMSSLPARMRMIE